MELLLLKPVKKWTLIPSLPLRQTVRHLQPPLWEYWWKWGKINWTDKVVEYIPEFKMYNPYVTANFTIVDLLTHRSGLGLGAGDLMFFPDGSDFTVDDVLRSFQYQTPVSDFRTKFDYDNLLYIVAGEVVHRVSGKSWDKFVEEEIMARLGMSNSVAVFSKSYRKYQFTFHTKPKQIK